MAYNITSKDQLFEYCKRRLGDPVVQVNVTEDQIDDCYQETLTFWQIYSTDGTEKAYIKHKVTGTKLTVADATGWLKDDQIVGLTDLGAETLVTGVVRLVEGSVVTINMQDLVNRFVVGGVKNKRTNATTAITAIVLGDVDNKYVPITSDVYGVTRLFPFSLGQGQSSSSSMFNLQYQLRLHELGDLSNVSMAYYVQTMTNMSMIDGILNGAPLFRFNRYHDRLVLDAAWGSSVNVDDWVLIEGYKTQDPSTFSRAYGDPWIVKHLTANIKQQWGANLLKYQGMQLPGGTTVDGQSMYETGTAEKKDLEDDMMNNGAPLEFQTG